MGLGESDVVFVEFLVGQLLLVAFRKQFKDEAVGVLNVVGKMLDVDVYHDLDSTTETFELIVARSHFVIEY